MNTAAACKKLIPTLRGLSPRRLTSFAANYRPTIGLRNVAGPISTRAASSTVNLEPFLNGSSGNYVEEMYEAWRSDPKSVHKVGGDVVWSDFVYCRIRQSDRTPLLLTWINLTCAQNQALSVAGKISYVIMHYLITAYCIDVDTMKCEQRNGDKNICEPVYRICWNVASHHSSFLNKPIITSMSPNEREHYIYYIWKEPAGVLIQLGYTWKQVLKHIFRIDASSSVQRFGAHLGLI